MEKQYLLVITIPSYNLILYSRLYYMMYKHNLLFTIIQSYILFQIGGMSLSDVDAIELKLDN